MDLTKFATPEFPIHPSGIKNLLTCPWRGVIETMSREEGPAGPAADTGSAVHKAIETYHTGVTAAVSLTVMGAERHKYPLADLHEAAALFLAYTAVPREDQVVAVELAVSFQIAPADDDPTGEAITIDGTVDQVRRAGRLSVWDVKTSKKDPVNVLRETMHQAAAYCVGASFALGETVHPGGIIMPRRQPMFIPFSWTVNDLEDLLAPLRSRVAEIRRGVVHHVPTAANCEWCGAGGPELCAPRKRRALL